MESSGNRRRRIQKEPLRECVRVLGVALVFAIPAMTTTGSAQWVRTTNISTTSDVTSLQGKGNFLFAGVRSSGVFRTSNAGDTWQSVNGGLSSSNLTALDFAVHQNLIFAAFGLGSPTGTFDLAFSSNDGASWVENQPGGISTSLVHSEGSWVYAATAVPFLGQRLVRSQFAAPNTWNWQNTALPGTAYSLTSNASFIFAGMLEAGVVYRYDGSTWIQQTTGSGGSITSITTGSPSYVFASPDAGAIYRSTNNGTNWTPSATISLTDSVYWLITMGGGQIAAATKRGVLVSINNGTSWTQMNQGFSGTQPVRALGIAGNFIFAGTPTGSIWRRPVAQFSLPVAPQVQQPTDRMLTLQQPIVFSWGSSYAATTYTLQLSRVQDFASIERQVTGITSPSQSVSGLADGRYYWRVGAINEMGTVWSTARMFSVYSPLPAKAMAIGLEAFPQNPTQTTEYRLVSMPGSRTTAVRAFIHGAGSGENKFDWRAWSDPGLGAFSELLESSVIQPGSGFWLIRKNGFLFSDSILLPVLSSDGMYAIANLHHGWNIIANPFDKQVSWSSIAQANNLGNAKVYTYQGSGYPDTSLLWPFKGYYYFNNDTARGSLNIPYPFETQSPARPPSPPTSWHLRLIVDSENSSDRHNFVGVAPSTDEQIDIMDERKPPLVFDQTFLYFKRSQWDQRFPLFCSDYRPAIGDGQVWEFEISNPKLTRTRLSIVGIETVPVGHSVQLVNLSIIRPIDVRLSNEVEFQPTARVTRFKLLIGNAGFVQREIHESMPMTFLLEQNYPNPFNPRTTINYQLPTSAHVTLKVYNTLGQEVATLVDAFEEAGHKSVELNASNMASGVYVYRLETGGVSMVRKCMVVK